MDFLFDQTFWLAVFGLLWALCEILNKTPLKSNSALDLVYNILKKIKELLSIKD